MIAAILPPDSAFSRAVYAEIRPVIARQHWPSDAMRVGFLVAPDGLSLIASFEGFPHPVAALAAQAVARAKVSLVLASPAAYLAQRLVKARRWRDMFLYGLLPLLFAIPLMAPLGDGVMRGSMGLFALDLLGLILTHARVLTIRAELAENRVIAMIPVPGLRLKAQAGTPPIPLS